MCRSVIIQDYSADWCNSEMSGTVQSVSSKRKQVELAVACQSAGALQVQAVPSWYQRLVIALPNCMAQLL
jgi:hypothetical protein